MSNSGLTSLIGILAFVVAMLLSVMIHEWGHFITARKYGAKVTEFFLGFGPRLWSTKRGETEFGIKAIPAGGYCRITGMTPLEPIAAEDAPRAFYKLNVSKRLIVLGAGSFLHFVLALLMLTLFFAAIGVPKESTRLSEVLPCIKSSAAPCTSSDPVAPAFIAGLQGGDDIRAIDGKAITTWAEVGVEIRNGVEKELRFTVFRDGQNIEISVTPMKYQSGEKTFGIIGVISERVSDRYPLHSAVAASVKEGGSIALGSLKALVALPSKIPALFGATFAGAERDPQGLVGVVGVARVSGEAASSEGGSLSEKIGFFLLIIASLNIFVGIFNLIPLLPLDGGHMAVALFDGFRRARARRAGLPEPAPFDLTKLMPITLAVIALMATLSVLLLFADLINPIRLNQ
jgi:membrane-associated protease RseP (regulator of RpoE activity)